MKPVLRRPHPTLILRRSKSLAATRIRLTKSRFVLNKYRKNRVEFFLRSPLNRARLKQVSLYIKQPEQVRTIAMRSERYPASSGISRLDAT